MTPPFFCWIFISGYICYKCYIRHSWSLNTCLMYAMEYCVGFIFCFHMNLISSILLSYPHSTVYTFHSPTPTIHAKDIKEEHFQEKQCLHRKYHLKFKSTLAAQFIPIFMYINQISKLNGNTQYERWKMQFKWNIKCKCILLILQQQQHWWTLAQTIPKQEHSFKSLSTHAFTMA